MLQLNTIKPLAELQAQRLLEEFRAARQESIENAIVTTSLGHHYNADERSIIRMANALLAMAHHPLDFETRWSMADTATGVMTTTTKADLVEAHRLAVEHMAAIWERQE